MLLVRMVDTNVATASLSGARKVQIFDSAWIRLLKVSSMLVSLDYINQDTDSAAVSVC